MTRLIVAAFGAAALFAVACGSATTNPDGGTGGGTGGGATGGGTGGGATGGGTGGGSATGPTWYKDVLPIVQGNCLTCHAAGGIGPFQLETYAQAQVMAPSMADSVTQKRMPPWMPSDACGGPFTTHRGLTPAQIDTINQWNTAGAPAGNPADAPPAPDGGVTGLPRVDATLTMPQAYTPTATPSDDYRCFIIDPALTATRQVTGYDIQPGVKAEVHHVIIYIVDKAAAEAKDAQEAGPGWTCFGGPGVNSTGTLGAWAPGMPAVIYPANTGVPLAQGSVLAMQIHYNTSGGTRVPDQTSLKLQYAQGSVTPAYLLPLVADGFAIPPNSMNYAYSEAFPNNYFVTLKVWGFLPHMHTLGKSIKITGPANACLIDIPKWDFNWQQQYFTAAPFSLPSGQSMTLSCTWDNPTNRTVRWGEGTADEMCFAYVYATL